MITAADKVNPEISVMLSALTQLNQHVGNAISEANEATSTRQVIGAVSNVAELSSQIAALAKSMVTVYQFAE